MPDLLKTTGLRWLWLTLLVMVLDQVSKFWASAELVLYKAVPVMPLFNLTLMHNQGAAFSFLSDAGGWQRWFFTLLALVVSVFLLNWMRKLKTNERWLAVALALVLGGALGNVIDRLMLGYVVDFIQVYWREHYFPAFNIADSAITVGAGILILLSLRTDKTTSQSEKVSHE